MSSDNQKAHRSKPKRSGGASGAPFLLPAEADLLGRCWLLASSADSLSPSRWFALTEKNRRGMRDDNRRAFSISPDPLPSSDQARQPVLRDLNVNVHRGLSVCGYANITITAVPTTAGQPPRTVRVGGVHVELPSLQPESEAKEEAGQYVVVVVRRLSVEAELKDYATAGYKRVAIAAPPTNAAERDEYGEGCITGILYGAVLVLHTQLDAHLVPRLVRLCEEAARASNVSPTALSVQEERAAGVRIATQPAGAAEETNAQASGTPWLRLLSVEAETKTADALRSEWAAARDAAPSGDAAAALRDDAEALPFVAAWAVHAHQTPSTWCPLNLFLQRYEAIADSLLVLSRRER